VKHDAQRLAEQRHSKIDRFAGAVLVAKLVHGPQVSASPEGREPMHGQFHHLKLEAQTHFDM